MPFSALPSSAAWRHQGLRSGFEVVFALRDHEGILFTGCTAAVEDGDHWIVDGQATPRLDGCLDVDLESSALTNAFPVHRLGLGVDDRASAPAAFVRAGDLGVDRLQQGYVRSPDDGALAQYDYTAPAFGFSCRLVYDDAGLVVSYPGIALRADGPT